MTDDRIDALLRRLDVPSNPDPDFMRSTYAVLRPRARAARVDDASRIGRLRRDLRLVLAGAGWPSTARPVAMVGLVVLLVLATLTGLAVVGALNQDPPVRVVPSADPRAAVVPSTDPSDAVVPSADPRAAVVPSTDPSDAVVPPRAPGWTATGSMNTPRYQFMATLLRDGRVLAAGGTFEPARPAELYDPVSTMWAATGSMLSPSFDSKSTLLPDGKVLVAGGLEANGPVKSAEIASAELYEPISGTWTATGAMAAGRRGHTLTLLADGKVLVAGGIGPNGLVPAAELYDPSSGTWTTTGAMATGRIYHTATLLPDGKVLVAGGHEDDGTISQGSPTAELYDPISGTWSATGDMVTLHGEHTATLLPDGRVLAVGGASDTGRGSAELYDPISGTWSATGAMVTPRGTHTATLLQDGKVLVAGGASFTSTKELGILASAELYDPARGTWSATASMIAGGQDQTATLLPDGRVLVAGGNRGSGTQASAELYDPGGGQ